MMNRLANCHNPYQGDFKRVLCVCSAGLLRSPTTAFVLSQPPFNFNTRAAGIDGSFALVPVDPVLVKWADEIVCMDEYQQSRLEQLIKDNDFKMKPVHVLKIPDQFEYRNPELQKLILEKCSVIFGVDA